MSKPIPVFTFVFAAYAATSAAPGAAAPGAKRRCDPFASLWNVESARSGGIYAKVGVLSRTTGPVRFAVQGAREAYEDLWLDEIVETQVGFIGRAMSAAKPPARIVKGQRLRFLRMNVLDWRLSDCQTACATPQLPCFKHAPDERLTELTETVTG